MWPHWIAASGRIAVRTHITFTGGVSTLPLAKFLPDIQHLLPTLTSPTPGKAGIRTHFGLLCLFGTHQAFPTRFSHTNHMAALAISISSTQFSVLLAEAAQLEQSIAQAASFSIEEASKSNESAEYIAITAWRTKASDVLVRSVTVLANMHAFLKEIHRGRWKA
jgi:hypothetical protein